MKKVLSSILILTMSISSIGTISTFADESEAKTSATTETLSEVGNVKVEIDEAIDKLKDNITKLEVKSFWQRNKSAILKVAYVALAAAATATAFYFGNKYLVANPKDIKSSSEDIQGSIDSVSSGESKSELVEGSESNTKSENLLEFTVDKSGEIVEFPINQMDNENATHPTDTLEGKQVEDAESDVCFSEQKDVDNSSESESPFSVEIEEEGQCPIDDENLNSENQITILSTPTQEDGENTTSTNLKKSEETPAEPVKTEGQTSEEEHTPEQVETKNQDSEGNSKETEKTPVNAEESTGFFAGIKNKILAALGLGGGTTGGVVAAKKCLNSRRPNRSRDNNPGKEKSVTEDDLQRWGKQQKGGTEGTSPNQDNLVASLSAAAPPDASKFESVTLPGARPTLPHPPQSPLIGLVDATNIPHGTPLVRQPPPHPYTAAPPPIANPLTLNMFPTPNILSGQSPPPPPGYKPPQPPVVQSTAGRIPPPMLPQQQLMPNGRPIPQRQPQLYCPEYQQPVANTAAVTTATTTTTSSEPPVTPPVEAAIRIIPAAFVPAVAATAAVAATTTTAPTIPTELTNIDQVFIALNAEFAAPTENQQTVLDILNSLKCDLQGYHKRFNISYETIKGVCSNLLTIISKFNKTEITKRGIKEILRELCKNVKVDNLIPFLNNLVVGVNIQSDNDILSAINVNKQSYNNLTMLPVINPGEATIATQPQNTATAVPTATAAAPTIAVAATASIVAATIPTAIDDETAESDHDDFDTTAPTIPAEFRNVEDVLHEIDNEFVSYRESMNENEQLMLEILHNNKIIKLLDSQHTKLNISYDIIKSIFTNLLILASSLNKTEVTSSNIQKILEQLFSTVSAKNLNQVSHDIATKPGINNVNKIMEFLAPIKEFITPAVAETAALQQNTATAAAPTTLKKIETLEEITTLLNAEFAGNKVWQRIINNPQIGGALIWRFDIRRMPYNVMREFWADMIDFFQRFDVNEDGMIKIIRLFNNSTRLDYFLTAIEYIKNYAKDLEDAVKILNDGHYLSHNINNINNMRC
ncbi:MAG: hypothetical protein RUMPE_00890 [Eubacteriales bacterium SKADARSKE-1]|nr:hypothetical protein [Eubacteriales bacterium SKADARSKE-1]